jgi:hypothetical protein
MARRIQPRFAGFILAGLLLLSLTQHAQAGYFASNMTGQELLNACEGQDLPSKVDGLKEVFELLCATYIAGFSDGYALKVAEEQTLKRPRLVCIPDRGVENGLLRATVTRWLWANRKDLDGMTARVAVHLALIKDFPCR